MLGVVSSKGVGRGALRAAVSVQSRGLKRPPVNTSQLEEGRRSGLLAMKVGMLPFYDKWGVRCTVTVLQADNVFVVQHKKNETEGYDALQLSVGEAKRKNLKGSQLGQYDKVGLVAGRDLQEFRITPDAAVEVGSQLHATHFVPGQLVDVCGTSKGKGFQGVMKRHNFSGGRATHGNSKNHRTPGSTGGAQDPGRTFKGQKMPGRMGGDRKTVQNLKVTHDDHDHDDDDDDDDDARRVTYIQTLLIYTPHNRESGLNTFPLRNDHSHSHDPSR